MAETHEGELDGVDERVAEDRQAGSDEHEQASRREPFAVPDERPDGKRQDEHGEH